MSEAIYRLEETVADEKWDAFVQKSPSGTLYSLADYMTATRQPVRLFWCVRGTEKRAAVCVTESADGQNAVLHDFLVYNGLMFAPRANKQNRSQIISEHFEIATDVAAALSARYPQLELALAPQVDDIRPFLWHNYGTSPQYSPDVRYTAYADLQGFAEAKTPEEVPLFAEISYARRQEVRKAIKAEVHTVEDDNALALADFYALTMRRQDISIDPEVHEALRFLAESLLQKKLARLFITRTAEGEAAAVALFGWDAKRAYYLFGAGDPQYRNTPCGTAVLWDGFKALALAGHTQVDLEGVNSPKRGWFKMSFGPELVPYYQLTKIGEEKA
ncbi:MAG: GNAT family N-acetyltransferase [Desulfovibrionaceae bacterium]